VVAVAILVMALTVMVAAVTKAVANNRLSKERAMATRLAQEGIDWIRNLRLSAGSWTEFAAKFPINVIYCDPNGSINNVTDLTTLSSYIVINKTSCTTLFEKSNSDYSRTVEIVPGSNDVTVTTDVFWYGGRTVRESVQAKTVLKKAL